jgi:hypothetical protein
MEVGAMLATSHDVVAGSFLPKQPGASQGRRYAVSDSDYHPLGELGSGAEVSLRF